MIIRRKLLMKIILFIPIIWLLLIIIFSLNNLENNRIQDEKSEHSKGELGVPVIIDESQLDPAERIKFDKGWKDNSFNNYVSDMISVRRSLPNIQDPACKVIQWYHPLPSTSVIIIFHNEAWSVLLRTIHSVLDRTDPSLLKEILLVDDFSDLGRIEKEKVFN
jgi:polypeptide N-acetylgalactosaminyltransferase